MELLQSVPSFVACLFLLLVVVVVLWKDSIFILCYASTFSFQLKK
jgi:hypothetical protein